MNNKKTYAFAHAARQHDNCIIAFTLSEVLITLGIIGVVAAMTMPAVIANHQKKVTVTKLKKAYTTLSQMLISSYADNGPIEFSSEDSVNAEDTEKFFNTYWLPYFSAPKVVKDGGSFYSSPIYNLNGSEAKASLTTKYSLGRIAFSTQDGIFYYVSIMRWTEFDSESNAVDGSQKYSTSQSVTIDINGKKLPNTMGKDMFLFLVNFDENIVKPYAYNNTSYISNSCSKTGSGDACASKIMKDGWEIKDDYPW